MRKHEHQGNITEPWSEPELVGFRGYWLTYDVDRYGNLVKVHLPGNQALPYRTLRVLGASPPAEVRQ